MRDLDRLQDVVEYRITAGQLRLAIVGALAVTCAIFAVGVTVGKRLRPAQPALAVDPLAELDRATRRASGGDHGGEAEAQAEEPPALTYHDELTNRGEPSRGESSARAGGSAGSGSGATGDGATARGRDEGDEARGAEQEPISDEPAVPEQPRPGESAVYTLQVASYETREEAEQFANDLRSRGHRVFLVRTSTPERGTWYRVRVGPFHSRREAVRAQARFERTERLPTFLVRRRR